MPAEQIHIGRSLPVLAHRQHAVMYQPHRARPGTALPADNQMRLAARQHEEIPCGQLDHPPVGKPQAAVAGQDHMKRDDAAGRRFVVDLEGAFEAAADVQAGAKPGKVDKAAENIHETIAL